MPFALSTTESAFESPRLFVPTDTPPESPGALQGHTDAPAPQPAVQPSPEPVAELQPTEEPVDPQSIESEPVDDEAKYFQELEAIGRLSALIRRRQKLFEVYQEAKREANKIKAEYDQSRDAEKDAKDEYEDTSEEVIRIAEELEIITKGKSLPVNQDDDEPVANVESEDGWRILPTAKLVKGIKGLGSNKLNKLVEIAPTTGDLEDLRAKASAGRDPFNKVLPKGFGTQVSEDIENRLIDHIAKWSSANQPASEQVKREVPTSKPKAKASPKELDKPVKQPAVDPRVARAEPIVSQIRSVANEHQWSMAFCQLHDEAVEHPIQRRGHQAFQNDMQPWAFDGPEDDLRDFIIGWVRAERLHTEGGDPSPETTSEALQPKPGEVYENVEDDEVANL